MSSRSHLPFGWFLAFGLGLGSLGCGSATPSASPSTSDAGADAAPADPPPADAAPADAKIRAAIASFLQNPGKGKDASKIVNFVGESSHVMVVYRESILFAEGSSSEIDRLMLVAFSAGNVRAQLDSGKKEDAPLDGVRAMIEVYAKLKAKDGSLKIPKFEEYVAHEEKGTLEAHVATLVAK